MDHVAQSLSGRSRYLGSHFTKPAWYAALARDPTGEKVLLLLKTMHIGLHSIPIGKLYIALVFGTQQLPSIHDTLNLRQRCRRAGSIPAEKGAMADKKPTVDQGDTTGKTDDITQQAMPWSCKIRRCKLRIKRRF